VGDVGSGVVGTPSAGANRVLSHRLIAFCDILGFSHRLQTSSLSELHAVYSRLMDHANTHIFQHDDGAQPDHRNFARAEFLFDSVLLVSNPLDSEGGPRAVADFMSALSSLFESSLGWHLPLRGAVTIGDVLEDVERRISLSGAFPGLVNAEKEQEWAGIRVLEPAVDTVLDGLYGTPDSEIAKNGTGHVFPYAVPTKNGPCPSMVLNWVYLCDQRTIDAGLSFLTGRKKDETADFVAAVQSRLPPDTRLPAPLGTVVFVRTRGYRVGFNIKFLDAVGNGADLPEGTTFQFSIVARASEGTPR